MSAGKQSPPAAGGASGPDRVEGWRHAVHTQQVVPWQEPGIRSGRRAQWRSRLIVSTNRLLFLIICVAFSPELYVEMWSLLTGLSKTSIYKPTVDDPSSPQIEKDARYNAGGVFIFIPRALQHCSHNEQDAAGNDRLSGRSSGPCRRQAGEAASLSGPRQTLRLEAEAVLGECQVQVVVPSRLSSGAFHHFLS